MKVSAYLIGTPALVLAVAAVLLLLAGSEKGESAVLEFNVTGGFWGRNDGFKLYSDGSLAYRVKGETVRTSTLPAQILTELDSRVEQLLRSYPSGLKLEPSGGADYFVYSLAIRRGGEVVTYRWTELSEVPGELLYLADLLRGVNDFLAGWGGVVVFIRASSLSVDKGRTLELRVSAFNLAQEDFTYESPTPCHPDLKVLLYREQAEPVELFPVGYDPGAPCIQVVQQRKLEASGNLHAEYRVTLKEEGTYTVEASFPYAEWNQRRFTSRITVTVKG